jgi:hypothetical protein
LVLHEVFANPVKVALKRCGVARGHHTGLFLMTVLAGGRTSLFHGVTRPAHPMGDILAEIRDASCSDVFPVTVLAIAFQVFLVRPVREGDAVFELEYIRTIFCKSRCCEKKNCRN